MQATDWDGNGVSVPTGSIALNGGSITSGSNIAASLTHSGIANDGDRKVQGSPDSSPSFGVVGSDTISSQTYPKGTAITALTLPAATGGNGLLTYSLAPPAGLVFNAAARVLSGAPTTTQNAVSYTVTDADGDIATLSFTITVDGALSFPADTVGAQIYAKGAAITRLGLPAATDGNTPLTYSLTPALPDGLVLDPATRAISGTPTTQNAVTYIYTVTDADGDTATQSFTITVDGTPSFPGNSDTLPAQTYAKSVSIATRTFPQATDGNTPLTYSLSPAPPNGLVFNATARTISGAPTTTQNAVTYNYTVTDADGDTDTLSIAITVDGAPSFPADAVGAQIYAKGAAIARLGLPDATDGNTPLTYSLTPALPDGLVLDPATRAITGTPTTTQNAVTYTHTVTDADGDTATQSFTITVDGTPAFPAAAVAAQTYAEGAAITSLTLPAATDGNTPLTYSITPALPDGLVFNATTRILSGTPTVGQAATTYTYTVTDADSDTDTKSFTIAVTGDHDIDGDGLIEVDSLAQLNAIRWDLNGDGSVDTGTSVADTAKYSAAFARASTGIICLRDHDAAAATAKVAGCIGYELTQDLDFDTDDDGATYTTSSAGVVTGDADDTYYNGDKGWKPVGDATNQFTATFDGNGKTISNLFIKDTATSYVGLFGHVGTGGRVERLGVRDVNVAGGNRFVGGLAGYNTGTISASYATGSVTAANRFVGGLAGRNYGTISASYATGSVTGNYHVGGLVGTNQYAISASYAAGSVTGIRIVGGLVGTNSLLGYRSYRSSRQCRRHRQDYQRTAIAH